MGVWGGRGGAGGQRGQAKMEVVHNSNNFFPFPFPNLYLDASLQRSVRDGLLSNYEYPSNFIKDIRDDSLIFHNLVLKGIG